MKTISVILFAIFTTLNFQTENYYVIKTKGDIYNETSSKNLVQGDAIKAGDKLKFTQKDAMALVISDNRGRFTIKYPDRIEESEGALTVFVKNALIANQQNRLSTRSVAIQSTVKHLDSYFGDNDFNVIGDKLVVKISKNYYPISRGYDIIARYFINDKEYGKELSATNQTMVLSRTKFELPGDKEVYVEDVDIFKMNVTADEEDLISTINLRFIVKADLEKEFVTIINKFDDGRISKSKLKSLLVNYFNEFYGKTDEFYLNQYISQLIIDNTNE
ncbi:MAG: hypothetical protein B6I20_02715 [Bacteroidetes bacterium 4572_117]|nr:MAG: hypothetical protein B6I20_02715 [Bacteroidetes bacterium 4572_117]